MDSSTIFEVDLQISIEKEFDRQKIKYRSKLVGWVKDSFVLAELPFVNGSFVNWQSGTACIIKFISKGNVYQFRATLIKSIHQPLPLLFLNYPRKIENGTSREHERIQTYLQCDLYPLSENLERREFDFIDPENFINNAVLLDFSRGGGLVEIKNNLTNFTIGEKAGMDFTLPSGDVLKKLVIEIRNIRIESGRKQAGIKFLRDNPEPVDIIEEFFRKYNTL